MNKRNLAVLALGLILATAPATFGQKGEPDRPPAPTPQAGPFVRAGNFIVNVSRIEHIQIFETENGKMLDVYLMGHTNWTAKVRGRDAAGLLAAMGLPPIEEGKPQP